MVGGHLVRTSPDPRTIDAEVSRLDWLRAHVPCPEPEVVDDGWLVVPLPEGAPAHRPETHPDPDALPAALGRSLRRLHEIDPAGCPFARDSTTIDHELTAAISAGLVDPGRLDEPYSRYEPDRLLELVRETRPKLDEGSVIVHGSPILSNLFLEGEEPGSVSGVHRLGVGDRHVDLAVITRQLQSAYGADAVFGFYQGYGRDPDLVRLDHYVLVDALDVAIVRHLTRP